jgi:hypothetical protein
MPVLWNCWLTSIACEQASFAFVVNERVSPWLGPTYDGSDNAGNDEGPAEKRERKSPVGNATQAGEKDYFDEVYYLEYCSLGLA